MIHPQAVSHQFISMEMNTLTTGDFLIITVVGIKVTRPCLPDGDTSVETTGTPDAPDAPGEA